MILAIVQARMGSTRLPGKVMMEILGKPVLLHLIDRLKGSKLIDKIVIATTEKERDIPIIRLSEESGLDYFAGSEDDVLDRYFKAAKKYGGDVIVRITADCPLIDPEIVDEIINYYLENKEKLDFVNAGRSYPEGFGVEVFSFEALKKAWTDARKPSEREHVTSYIWKNKDIFRTATYEYGDESSRISLAVDNKNDFQLVTRIFENLYKNNQIFTLDDILNFLSENPHLLQFNKTKIRDEGYLKSLEIDKIALSKK